MTAALEGWLTAKVCLMMGNIVLYSPHITASVLFIYFQITMDISQNIEDVPEISLDLHEIKTDLSRVFKVNVGY